MLSTGKFLKSIKVRIYNTMISDIFCVCFDVMYSGEYNVFDVTLRVYPHRAGRKVSLTTVGIEPATFGGYLWYFGTKSSIFDTNVFYDHDLTFQPARCGYTLRVT
jgi:hypothetical protein